MSENTVSSLIRISGNTPGPASGLSTVCSYILTPYTERRGQNGLDSMDRETEAGEVEELIQERSILPSPPPDGVSVRLLCWW